MEKWYEINVKKYVLDKLRLYFEECKMSNSKLVVVLEDLSKYSVRDMMEPEFLKRFPEIENVDEVADLISKLYMEVRTRKYGTSDFWNSSKTEREIGYNGEWESFILNLIERYAKKKDAVLFVGASNGEEVPRVEDYDFYALEQISSSVTNITNPFVKHKIVGDFEDESLIVDNSKKMNLIIALRCLMPNTRLDRFFKFITNNLVNDGHLILSHPLSYLSSEGDLLPLENAQENLNTFKERLSVALSKIDYEIIYEEQTTVEYIIALKRGN